MIVLQMYLRDAKQAEVLLNQQENFLSKEEVPVCIVLFYSTNSWNHDCIFHIACISMHMNLIFFSYASICYINTVFLKIIFIAFKVDSQKKMDYKLFNFFMHWLWIFKYLNANAQNENAHLASMFDSVSCESNGWHRHSGQVFSLVMCYVMFPLVFFGTSW